MNPSSVNKLTFKSFILTIVATLLLSFTFPMFSPKVSASSYTENQLEEDLYNQSLTENPNFKKDLLATKLRLSQEIYKQSNPSQVSPQGMLGGGLKGLKYLGSLAKHGGTSLSWLLKPFSKKTADTVKRNSHKIADALAK